MFTRVFIFGMVLAALLFSTAGGSRAESSDKGGARKGDATQGQALFNGKGICHYCHGIDGVIGRKPRLNPDTEAVVAPLAAPAPDLRNRAMLRLKDNNARFRAIRDGHPGSGMFPDRSLSDQDITDLLAYLAMLRQSTSTPNKSPY